MSKRFYKELGFTLASEGGGVAYFHLGHASFLLQDFCPGSFADNEMMHLLVQDVDAWWEHITNAGLMWKTPTRRRDSA